jgi:hypothetical protein
MKNSMQLLSVLVFYMLGYVFLSAQTEKPVSTSTELVLKGSDKNWPKARIQPLSLGDGRVLLAISDTVYMLGKDGKELWKYQNEALTCEPAFNAATNEIAVLMYDLQAARIDATSGTVKWKSESVGKGVFTQVSAFEKGFLVVVDMSGYRDNSSSTPADRLEYWSQSEKNFWFIGFPRGAELTVIGTKPYALFRTEDTLRLKELKIPVHNK